jgi:hypothetical protein
VRKEGERLVGRLSEEERGKLRWEHVGSTSIKVSKSWEYMSRFVRGRTRQAVPGTRGLYFNKGIQELGVCGTLLSSYTLPLILNVSEGHHHFWHRRDPAPRLRPGSGKERSNVRGQSVYSRNIAVQNAVQ